MNKSHTNYSRSAVEVTASDKLSEQLVPPLDGEETPEEGPALQYSVPLALAGERLDKALAQLLNAYSRSRIQAWIASGQVRLNGQTAKNRQTVFAGDQLQLLTAAFDEISSEASAFIPEPIAFERVYEDAQLIVVNKVAGLVVHPAAGNWRGTLMNGLLYDYPDAVKLPRAGIVHRLDKDTSGLMVVARTLEAQTDLVRQLQARSVKRRYLALAWGEVPAHGTVDAPIGRDPHVRTRMAISSAGKPARTYFQRLASVLVNKVKISLICCQLDTGRTHQIRVHMASLKHPLVGDALYGRALTTLPQPFSRQALHAYELGLLHPSTRMPLLWSSEVPADMAALMQALGFPAAAMIKEYL